MKSLALALVLVGSIFGLVARTTFWRSPSGAVGTPLRRPDTTSPRPLPRFETSDSPEEPGGPQELTAEEAARRMEDHRLQGPPRRDVVVAVVAAIPGVLEPVTRETQGTVDSVDCRGDGCVVDLSWKDRENALAQKDALLAAGSRLPCRPRFALRGADGADDGRVVLFLDGCRATAPSPE